jgi:inhibitor of cysteine peptidase
MPMIALGEDATGRTIDVQVGQVVEVRLAENRSTGFQWRLVGDPGRACRVVDGGFEPAPGGMLGRGGTHAWRITASGTGECSLALAYARPWEASAAPARTFALHLRIGG